MERGRERERELYHAAYPFLSPWRFWGFSPSLLWVMLPWTSTNNSLVNGHFHFYWVNTSDRIAGLYDRFIFNFLKNKKAAILFSKVAVSFYISTSNVWGFHFSPHACQFLYYYLFWYSHSVGCKMLSTVVLIFNFLMANDVEHFFMCL